MTVLEHLPLNSPLKLHKDSIDCLKNEVIDMAGFVVFIVNE